MTLVNVETGAVITEADVDASIARVLESAESIWDEWAWQVENETWTVKGYGSWDEMRREVYGGLTSISAPREERPELIARFRNAGLTQRETAETLGVGKATVERHDTVPGARGPSRKSSNEEFPDTDVIEAELIEEDEPEPEPRRPHAEKPAAMKTMKTMKTYKGRAPVAALSGAITTVSGIALGVRNITTEDLESVDGETRTQWVRELNEAIGAFRSIRNIIEKGNQK